MHQEIIYHLNEIGYYPEPAEVILSIGEAVPAIWDAKDSADTQAIVVLVEELLYSTNRYHQMLSSSLYGH